MKWLGYVNLAGVLLLTALCCIQWTVNRRTNLHAIDLERIRRADEQKIAEDARAIEGCHADRDEFRGRLERSEASLKDCESKLVAMTAEHDRVSKERDQAVRQRDQCAASLTKWKEAVSERDEALKKARDQVKSLVAARDDSIQKLNDLIVSYNKVVKDLNEARARGGSGH